MRSLGCQIAFLGFVVFVSNSALGARGRDFGLEFGEYKTGRWNAITDVKGVSVGHVTLKSGEGKLVPGKGPVRTGVTVINPSPGNQWKEKLMAGSFVLNGNGEAMGLMWLKESGILETPIALTNTLSVADVQKGMLQWMLELFPKIGVKDDTLTPVVFECDDGGLNDIRGMHVKPIHVTQALKNATTKLPEEGGVGAGTGMISYDFKGGIGTSSRVLSKKLGGYTVGVLVNANHGERHQLRMGGVEVGKAIKDLMPVFHQEGSIIVVVATDAPLDARQLNRLAKRAMLGLARTGAVGNHGSGDVAIAFSTANRVPHYPTKSTYQVTLLSDFFINPLFEAVADATEESMVNALVAGKTTTGRSNHKVYGIPHDRLKRLLKQAAPVSTTGE